MQSTGSPKEEIQGPSVDDQKETRNVLLVRVCLLLYGGSEKDKHNFVVLKLDTETGLYNASRITSLHLCWYILRLM